jgi:hypothetical protein
LATLTRQQLATFPWRLFGPSAAVDLLRLYAGCTQAVRLRLTLDVDVACVLDWGRANALGVVVDEEQFVALASNFDHARHVLQVDAADRPHELALGVLLGYPLCCAQEIARVGENAIDPRAREIATWRFPGRWAAIDPAGYLAGRSLISHLPCSERCAPSLRHAGRALERLGELRGVPAYVEVRNWAGSVVAP